MHVRFGPSCSTRHSHMRRTTRQGLAHDSNARGQEPQLARAFMTPSQTFPKNATPFFASDGKFEICPHMFDDTYQGVPRFDATGGRAHLFGKQELVQHFLDECSDLAGMTPPKSTC